MSWHEWLQRAGLSGEDGLRLNSWNRLYKAFVDGEAPESWAEIVAGMKQEAEHLPCYDALTGDLTNP